MAKNKNTEEFWKKQFGIRFNQYKDADLIEELSRFPQGQRSDRARELMRKGLQLEKLEQRGFPSAPVYPYLPPVQPGYYGYPPNQQPVYPPGQQPVYPYPPYGQQPTGQETQAPPPPYYAQPQAQYPVAPAPQAQPQQPVVSPAPQAHPQEQQQQPVVAPQPPDLSPAQVEETQAPQHAIQSQPPAAPKAAPKAKQERKQTQPKIRTQPPRPASPPKEDDTLSQFEKNLMNFSGKGGAGNFDID